MGVNGLRLVGEGRLLYEGAFYELRWRLGVFKVYELQGAGNRWGMRNGFPGDFFWSFGGILRVFLF